MDEVIGVDAHRRPLAGRRRLARRVGGSHGGRRTGAVGARARKRAVAVGGIMSGHCRRAVLLKGWAVAFETGVGWERIHVMLGGG